MEKKTMDTLRVMLCGELDDIAKQGKLSHESLDIVKDLLSSMKNLEKLEKMEKEKEFESMDMMMMGGNPMGGYSQRSMGRYYIDGEYDGGGLYGGDYNYARANGGGGNRSYRGGSYAGGNSNAGGGQYARRGGGSYDTGGSYMYYDPRYDYPMYSMNDGYSRRGNSKEEMILELKELMKQANDESIRKAIAEVITKIEKQTKAPIWASF